MPSTSYLIAHRALPLQAGSRPTELWEELSGRGWSSWLAMIGMRLKIEVRHIGVEGAPLGKAVIRRDGLEMLAMYFPEPEAIGEPYFAILARRAGDATLHSYVFERGSTSPEEPVRVVMAEWTFRDAQNFQRMVFDVTSDASLEASLARVVATMNDGVRARVVGPAEPPSVPVLDRAKLVPKLRHERWMGWTELPSRPLLDLPIKGMPRVAAGMDTREQFVFVQSSDLDASTQLADLVAIAIANLVKRPEFWTVKEKSKGMFGIGAKPTLVELVAEHAVARILDASFLEKAHELLKAPLLAVAVPFHGVMWARAATTSVEETRAFAQTVRGAFANVPRGVEPITPHVFTVMNGKLTGVILGDGDDKPGELEPTGGFRWPVRPA